MPKFDWAFDAHNYLPNKNKNACKLPTGNFVKHVGKQLDDYKLLDWDAVKSKRNTHACFDLSRKNSEKAKRLAKHLENINRDTAKTESAEILPYQIAIKNFPSKKEFRVFGYRKRDKFFLIYLDPDHEIYKE